MTKKFDTPLCEVCESRVGSIFSSLGKDALEEMSMQKNCNFYKRGQTIFYEGNRSSGLYCVFQGKIKVFKLGDEGRDQIVRLAKKGDILGYRALISGEVYSASAAAIEDCMICFISRSLFLEYLERFPQMTMKVMRLFSLDLKKAESRLTDLTQKPVRERMAEAICMIKETFGVDKEGNIDANLTRQEFANIIGTTTETAIRFLSNFKKEKLIDMNGRKIRILDQGALLREANLWD